MPEASVTVRGVALHSGVRCTVRLHRADGAVRFARNGTFVPARVEDVVGTPRCTVLGAGGERVALVEHLLAALHVRGWWSGLVIEVDASELPILDGSALPWLEPLEALGPPPAPPAALEVASERTVAVGDGSMRVLPGEAALTASIDFAHPAIGRQTWEGAPDSFEGLLAARTFGFLAEVEALRSRGLAVAATTENAIVFDSEGSLSPLRFPDEPVRHKALDALGDLFLLGRPLAGRVAVERGSHALHVAFARALLPEASGVTTEPGSSGSRGGVTS